MITVKQELERAEERIELVEYRSAERASEIEEGLESYVTKVRAALYAIQAWLHLYLVSAFMQYSEILRIIVILHVNPFHCQMWPKASLDQISKFHFPKL